MKTLHIGDRFFDPSEIEHFELVDTTLYVFYRNSSLVSKVRFETYEEAALEYYVLPSHIRKFAKRRT